MKNKVLAIIPARGGSKRIPRKNIKNFFGVPIIQYSIDAAIESKIFDEVMVSTDDQQIAEIAKQLGSKVPFFRSEEMSNDFATTSDVIIEVLEKYKQMNCHFDYVCCLYATAPFITAKKLQTAFKILKDSEADSVFPVAKFSFPIQRALKIDDGLIKMIWPENINKRSQDLQTSYFDCGQFYFIKTNHFFSQKKLYTEKSYPIVTDELEAQDIDNEIDWKMAELKYQIFSKKSLV